MVFFFVSQVDPRFLLYVGADKYENEELIKCAWQEDVWFHTDGYSSAHIYVRCPDGVSWSTIPHSIVLEAASITKSQSIEGSKAAKVQVSYTPASNLKKTAGMEIGAVSFHKMQLVKRVGIEGPCKSEGRVYTRLRTTRTVDEVKQEYEDHQKEVRLRERKAAEEQKRADREAIRQKNREEAEQRIIFEQACEVDDAHRGRQYDADRVKRAEARAVREAGDDDVEELGDDDLALLL